MRRSPSLSASGRARNRNRPDSHSRRSTRRNPQCQQRRRKLRCELRGDMPFGVRPQCSTVLAVDLCGLRQCQRIVSRSVATLKRERHRSQQRGTTNDPQDGELLHSLTVSGSVAPAAVSVKRTALTVSCFCSFWTRTPPIRSAQTNYRRERYYASTVAA